MPFAEYDMMTCPAGKVNMAEWTGGGRTVVQIFIRDGRVGEADSLYALERAGKFHGMPAA